MHPRSRLALALAGAGLALAVVALLATPAAAVLQGLAGVLLLAALAAALRWWPPRPGLAFRRPGAGERWCSRCGHPTPRSRPCRSCGHAPAAASREPVALRQKPGLRRQERKTQR